MNKFQRKQILSRNWTSNIIPFFGFSPLHLFIKCVQIIPGHHSSHVVSNPCCQRHDAIRLSPPRNAQSIFQYVLCKGDGIYFSIFLLYHKMCLEMLWGKPEGQSLKRFS